MNSLKGIRITKVIAISGASGAGKTTVVKQLAETLNCPFLLFDDHTDKETYPADMKKWFENGANVSLIKTPKFIQVLKELKSKNTNSYIFIEEPFGKERKSISALIDRVILLDLPMEICLSRLITRHIKSSNSDPLKSVSSFLLKYEDHLRDIYITCVDQVRKNCDLLIKNNGSIKKTTISISHWLENNAK